MQSEIVTELEAVLLYSSPFILTPFNESSVHIRFSDLVKALRRLMNRLNKNDFGILVHFFLICNWSVQILAKFKSEETAFQRSYRYVATQRANLSVDRIDLNALDLQRREAIL